LLWLVLGQPGVEASLPSLLPLKCTASPLLIFPASCLPLPFPVPFPLGDDCARGFEIKRVRGKKLLGRSLSRMAAGAVGLWPALLSTAGFGVAMYADLVLGVPCALEYPDLAVTLCPRRQRRRGSAGRVGRSEWRRERHHSTSARACAQNERRAVHVGCAFFFGTVVQMLQGPCMRHPTPI